MVDFQVERKQRLNYEFISARESGILFLNRELTLVIAD